MLGYRTNRHEGKVTGLAGRGRGDEAKEFLRTPIDCRDSLVTAQPGRRFIPTDKGIPDKTRRQMLGFSAPDLAAGGQDLTEEIVCGFVADRAARLGERNVVLAGGWFANVQLNRRSRELPEIDGDFVRPNMGDSGLALGAAASAWFRRTGEPKVRCADMYLGPEPGADPSGAAIRDTLNPRLNRHEEPIVLTIGDGLAALADGTVDAVVDRVNDWTTS